MKITAQEEYGLRCLLQLARQEDKQLTVKEIARQEGISHAYAEKLLRLLSKGGLTHSVRGTGGGYSLQRPLHQITLGDAVRALGRVPTTTEICERFPGNRVSCIHMDNCGIRSIWAGLTHHIQQFLDQTPLTLLMQSEQEVQQAVFARRAT